MGSQFIPGQLRSESASSWALKSGTRRWRALFTPEQRRLPQRFGCGIAGYENAGMLCAEELAFRLFFVVWFPGKCRTWDDALDISQLGTFA